MRELLPDVVVMDGLLQMDFCSASCEDIKPLKNLNYADHWDYTGEQRALMSL
jgi:hypothetical protein